MEKIATEKTQNTFAMFVETKTQNISTNAYKLSFQPRIQIPNRTYPLEKWTFVKNVSIKYWMEKLYTAVKTIVIISEKQKSKRKASIFCFYHSTTLFDCTNVSFFLANKLFRPFSYLFLLTFAWFYGWHILFALL